MFGFHVPSIPAFLRDYEPARLQAVKAAAIVLLASVGVTLSTDVDARITSVVGVLATILAAWQAESTRSRVFSPAHAADLLAELPPGYEEVDADGNPVDPDADFEAAAQDSAADE